ncbi:unnamed protein product [Trichobilharzia szidati]|nr:unnamed protein product [Trichobilharzia szidati]
MNDEINRNILQSSSHSAQNKMSTKNSNPEMNTDNGNNNNTVPKYQGRPLAIAEEWIQATEARYDSMENLLQSVRRDIDVLTERLNQTTPTSPELVRSPRPNSAMKTTPPATTTTTLNVAIKSSRPTPPPIPSSTSLNRKDVMDNYKCMDEEPMLLLTDKDEFMDIHIRSARENVDFDNEEKLLDCDFVHQVADASTTTNDGDNNNNNAEEKYLQKTWRSPSDFSLHDPFYDKSFTDVNMHSKERGGDEDGEDEDDDEIIRYNFNSHNHQSIIETDLDDYKPEHQENSNTESESSSLSPAISPTFSNYVSDEVKLRNIIISNDDTITFPISANYSRSSNNNNSEEIEDNIRSNTNANNVSLNSEDFQLYDNGHSLTTIDEASEENDDDWSSSEHDSPVNHSTHYTTTTTTTTTEQQQVLLKENNSKAAYKLIPDYSRNNQLLTNQSINEEFKLSSSNNANNNNITETGEYTDLDNTLKHKVSDTVSDNNYSESFVFHEKDITISDSGLQTPEVIILRRKKAGNSTVNSENCKKQRPLSADILHTITTTSTSTVSTSVSTTDTPIISNKNNKSLEKSHSGSLVSMLSTISQESVISEVDSYVTVCSRLAGTGSEEAYTTAQSDSDGFIDRTLYADVQTDNDDCQTLSRKKPKTSTSSHYRNNNHKYKIDLSHDDTDSQSASDIENDHVGDEGEEIGNVIVYESKKSTPTSVTVVTPKFIKLPTKLIACSSELGNNDNDDENDGDDDYDDKKALQGENLCHGDNNIIKNRKIDKKYEELSVIVQNVSSENQDNNKMVNRQVSSTLSKRIALKRPNRRTNTAKGIPLEVSNTSDSDNEYDDSAPNSPPSSPSSTSSSNSDELNEAHYDTSQSELWMDINYKQLGGIIQPNSVYRPNLYSVPSETKKKRLSKIVESSQGSLNDADDDDNDDEDNENENDYNNNKESHSNQTTDSNFLTITNVNNEVNTSSSNSLRREEAVVVVPKFSNTNLPPLPTNIFKSDTFKQELINKNTRALTQSDYSLVKNNEPVTPGVQHTKDNDNDSITVNDQSNKPIPISCLNNYKEDSEKLQLEIIDKDGKISIKNNQNENSASEYVKNSNDPISENTELSKSNENILRNKLTKEKESADKDTSGNQNKTMYHNNMRLPQSTSTSTKQYNKNELFFPKHVNTNDYQSPSTEEKTGYRQNGHNQVSQHPNSSNIYSSNIYDNSVTGSSSSYRDDKLQTTYPKSYHTEYSGNSQPQDGTSMRPESRTLHIRDETNLKKPYDVHTVYYNETIYDNELNECNKSSKSFPHTKNQPPTAISPSSSILAKSPFIVEDRSRHSNSRSHLFQEKEVSTNSMPFVTVEEITSHRKYQHQNQPHSETLNIKQDDIQLASQRKSRILQGDGSDLNYPNNDSIRYIPGPLLPDIQMPQKTYIESQSVTTLDKNAQSYKGNETTVTDLTGIGNDEETYNYHSYESVTVKDETHKSIIKPDEANKSSQENTYPILPSPNYKTDTNYNVISDESFKVNAPTKNLQSSSSHTPSTKVTQKPAEFVYRQRQMSPSPPRHRHILSSSSLTSKPPSQYIQRTKWHLKPIPTDEEIRERLRSSSRKRFEERKSRSIQNPQPTTTYRPRSSRSDSRYRFTDLDSAIAESKLDTNEAIYQMNTESDSHSEARQSASLFDLDAQIHKSYTPIIPSYQHHTEVYHTINQTDQLSMKKFLGDTKSYSSLLETDIDTGENFKRPVILETDLDKLNTQINDGSFDAALVDTYQDRTRSLYNLTFTHTPGAFRRQRSNDINGDSKIQPNEIELIQSPDGQQWEKAKSYQGLTNDKGENDSPKPQSQFEVVKSKRKAANSGAQGLIDRLKEKARSTHELRVAQSLTKLHIPEWLDKANCLQTSDIITLTAKEHYPSEYRAQVRQPIQRYYTNTTYTPRSTKSVLSSLRSLSSTSKPGDNNNITYSSIGNTSLYKKIETVAEPVWPKSSDSTHPPNFIRPSQLIRQKSAQNNNLRPIQSKLNNSMRSLSAQRFKTDERQDDIRPQVAPRQNRTIGQGKLIELNPQDFIPKYEQRWGKDKLNTLHHRLDRATTEPLEKSNPPDQSTYLNYSKLNSTQYTTTTNTTTKINLISSPTTEKQVYDAYSKNTTTSFSDIKDADHDSGTENSNERQMLSPEHDMIKKSNIQHENITSNISVKSNYFTKNDNQKVEYSKLKNDIENETRLSLDHSEGKESSEIINVPDKIYADSEFHSVDAEGETESEVTDGFDQISDLTCLTSLLDTCSSRHRSLLANRPSALEHLLVSVGWWPVHPDAEHHYLPPTAAEAISIAAHEFDVKEDSHRYEYFQLISGPHSFKPLNLGEFGLNQLSSTIVRHPVDGLLYISCSKSTCSTKPVPVSQASRWCACANCFTLYCSNKCREECEKNANDHPMNCSFSRAKRVCNRLLRNLAPGQITGLTALAKTGMARLGRGGILLPFALIRHAEIFLQRSLEHSFVNEQLNDASMEKAVQKWEKFHQPSPGGLMAPPTYLTLSELEELDSSIANPCRSYNPASSMVLIVVICAYELIARSDGRPVHLFKQSLILPFPSHQNVRNKNEGGNASQNTQVTENPQPPSSSSATAAALQTNGAPNKSDKQAMAAREAYMLRLQRMLRERGVSLRHHYPEIYTKIAHFVETGIPFTSIRITFDDFLLQQQVNCIIQPMKNLYIEPVNKNYDVEQKNLIETEKPSTNLQSKHVKSSKSFEKSIINRQRLTETNF